jgi:hypothetical protein
MPLRSSTTADAVDRLTLAQDKPNSYPNTNGANATEAK